MPGLQDEFPMKRQGALLNKEQTGGRAVGFADGLPRGRARICSRPASGRAAAPGAADAPDTACTSFGAGWAVSGFYSTVLQSIAGLLLHLHSGVYLLELFRGSIARFYSFSGWYIDMRRPELFRAAATCSTSIASRACMLTLLYPFSGPYINITLSLVGPVC